MKNVPGIITAALLIVVAVGALYAGYSFIADPSGSGIGMDTSYLSHSPFRNFLIPGIVLFVVNGVLNIIAVVAVIKKVKNYSCYIIIQGILLCGWIIAQVLLIKDIAMQHVLFFSIGVIITRAGMILRKKAAVPY